MVRVILCAPYYWMMSSSSSGRAVRIMLYHAVRTTYQTAYGTILLEIDDDHTTSSCTSTSTTRTRTRTVLCE